MILRNARFRRRLPLCAGALLAAACGGSSPSAPQPASVASLAAEPFSGERAWAHLVALSDLGPRPSGSPAHQEASEYIRSRLEEMEIQVVDLKLATASAAAAAASETPEADGSGGAEDAPRPAGARAHHLVAHIPGESPDVVLLMAHYDTLPDSVGANDGASGAALLLELARQLSERPLPYTTDIVFLDQEMAVARDEPTRPLFIGADLLTGHLRHTSTLETIRVAVAFRQVADADLAIGRDLHSHRLQREAFFDTAEALGLGAAFPRDRGYVESESSHRAFVVKGMPRIVSIQDPWYGGDEVPGEHWGAGDVPEHCSPRSLETVGVVALTALRRISTQLEKIDRISGRAERRRIEVMEPAELTGEAVDEPAAGEAPAGSEPAREPGDAPEPPPEAVDPAAEPEPAPESS